MKQVIIRNMAGGDYIEFNGWSYAIQFEQAPGAPKLYSLLVTPPGHSTPLRDRHEMQAAMAPIDPCAHDCSLTAVKSIIKQHAKYVQAQKK